MGWFIRVDRFADTHVCFSQEQGMSCGLASAKMAVFKVNKLRGGAAALTTEARVEQTYKRYAPKANVGVDGVDPDVLASTLNDLGIGHWTCEYPAHNRVTDVLIEKLKQGRPVVIGVTWPPAGAGIPGGGHALLADAIHHVPLVDAYWASICDPADGNVHITRLHPGHGLSYQGRRAGGSVNFWGKPEHNYTAGTSVRGTAFVLIYCDTPPK